MNQVVIIFVPTDMTKQDFESALREHLPTLEINGVQKPATQANPRQADELPFWTWFLPNPIR